ncbi:RING zinc finger-containing protein [Tieghemostelium lacteum]|uniref:RING zinc finger-containing protein n=1 Tax=Tieghemostelium lacteum TaxID=361077 RepID=A0A151ZJF1_TIELA|nr:RING zinc finger-containing protein [Tieghemostelium lacteum]|eukprot:KYQ93934.1 RING zinc finger-containing protein [Tieghemostelium lacteum]
MDEINDDIECAFCLEEITKFAVPFSNNLLLGDKHCRHNFCYFCLKQFVENKLKKHEKPLCPLCNEPFDGFIENRMANELFQKSKNLFSKSKVLQNDNDNLENSLLEKEQAITQLSKKVKEVNKECSQKEMEGQNLRQRVEHLEFELSETSQTRLKELEGYQMKIDLQQQEILKLAQNKQDLMEIQSKQQELQLKIKYYEQTVRDLEQYKLEQSRKQSQQEQQIQQHGVNSQKLKNIIQSQQEEIEKLKNQIQETQSIYYNQMESTDRYTKTIQDMDSAISALKIELFSSKTQINDLQQKNRNLEKRIEEFTVQKTSSSSSSSSYSGSLLDKSLVGNVGKLTSNSVNALTNSFSYLMGSRGVNNNSSANGNNSFVISWKSFSIFESRNQLKSGSNSCLVKRIQYNGYQYALKSIPYQPPTGLAYYTQQGLTDSDILSFREPMLLHKLSHVNLLKLEGMTKDDSTGMFYSILSPFAQMDLEFVIAEYRRSPPTWQQVKMITYQMLSAISYMHSQDLVHRDIKPTSVLVYPDSQIKLCSLTKSVSVFTYPMKPLNNTVYSSSSSCYLPPEYLLSIIDTEYNNNNQNVSNKSMDWKSFDVWSVGVVALELIFGRKLFATQNPKKNDTQFKEFLDICCNIFSYREITATMATPIKELNLLGKKFPVNHIKSIQGELCLVQGKMPEDFYALLTSMLCFDPSQRLKSEQAVNHPTFTSEPYYCKKDSLKQRDIASALTDSNIRDFLRDKCYGLIQV